jgi:acyl-CoA thioester hydrolase
VARVEYLELHAGGYQRLRELGIEALVLESHVRYLQPARFDDRLVIHARCVDLKGARFRYEYAIECDGVVIADGWTAHATVDGGTLRPTRVPTWLAEAIANAERSAPGRSSSR